MLDENCNLSQTNNKHKQIKEDITKEKTKQMNKNKF